MKFIKNILFDDLHLFETSLLGKPCSFHYKEQTILVIPCYQPVFIDKDNIEKSGNKSFLIFDYVEYYSYEQNLYSKDLTAFLGIVRTSTISFNQNYAKNCNKLASIGILDSGIGELSFTIVCNNFHIVSDLIKLDYTEINAFQMLNDSEISNHLLFPNLEFVDKLLRDEFVA